MRHVLLVLCCSAGLLPGAVTITIKYPVPDQELGMIAQASGTASSTTGRIVSVEARIDGGAWVAASTDWTSAIYAKDLRVGNHTFEARATDSASNKGSAGPVTFRVFHIAADCDHSVVKTGVYCEKGTTATNSDADSIANTFAGGYHAGDLLVVMIGSMNRHVPFTGSEIRNTAGYTWHFEGTQSSLETDDDLVHNALWWTIVPATNTSSDTIAITHVDGRQHFGVHPNHSGSSRFMVMGTLVYSGLGSISGSGAKAYGWTGYDNRPGPDQSGPFAVAVGDVAIGFCWGAPARPLPGTHWKTRLIDSSRPFMMVNDWVADSTTANARCESNPEGFTTLAVAFHPSAPH
jgi:hypothetical protein